MQPQLKIKRENIHRFLCRNCGANMIFNPQNGQLTCSYCQYAQVIETSDTIEKKDYQSHLRHENERLQPMAKEALQVNCDGCGAIVNFTPPETARECDFCAAKIVAQPKSADPLIAPKGVLPFSVTDNQANDALKNWIASLWFAPGALKNFTRAKKINSVYIPYWTYDALASTEYSGKRGDYYHIQGKGRKTSWVETGGFAKSKFDDVCIPATKSLPQKYLEKLEPWDLQELKPYEPAYLSGHKAQTYQVALEEGFERFKARAKDVIYKDVCKDIGGDTQKLGKTETKYSNITFKHLLLPVYAGAYQFNGRIFQVVINGRTGEVHGERPYSWVKITTFILSVFFVLVILYSIFKLIIHFI